MPLEPLIEAGRLHIKQVDPAELSAGEFGHIVSSSVRPGETGIVVIDSLNGYLNAMPSERFLTLQLHELLTYLGQQGVSTLLLLAQHGMMGPMGSPVDASYLADSVILLRYFEAFGEIRQAISVVKKRTGKHERTIRELKMDNGITVGKPLEDFQGVLTGMPEYVGTGPDMAAGVRSR
jgi:circadian clock protein KaiC